MATLLGVGEVILEQARSPALVGGGDLLVTSTTGRIGAARFLLSNVLGSPPLAGRARLAAPAHRAQLYLVEPGRSRPVLARGGVPSLERALGDPETARLAAWVDAARDRTWSAPAAADVLRTMDAFHTIPDVPERAASWAEWLYFNGRAGDTRFYLTFLVGAKRPSGKRIAGVRLQLDRAGRQSSYSDSEEIEEAPLLAEAPDLRIARNQVQLQGLRYHIALDLPAEPAGAKPGGRVRGELFVEAVPGRAMPPLVLHGAAGWQSGYVVPVMSGGLGGVLRVGGTTLRLDGGTGYHDHNWGFWKGVAWRWGQVQHEGLSFVYGRVYPPADAADPERLPGFLAALGPDGPIGYASQIQIEESDDGSGRPRRITVRGRSAALDLTLEVAVEDAVVTRMAAGLFGEGMDFLQLRGQYRARGRVAGREVDFSAPGSAETFRGR
jgi:hypothetical protein